MRRFAFSLCALSAILLACESSRAADFNRAPLLPAPDLNIATAGGINKHVRLDDGSLLVCGSFSRIGDVHRSGFAIINADGSLNEQFDPQPDRILAPRYERPRDCAIAADSTYLYIGGMFSEIDGQPLPNVARYALSDFTLDTDWRPALPIHFVNSMTATNGALFIQYESLEEVDTGDGNLQSDLLAKVPTMGTAVAAEWQIGMSPTYDLRAASDGFLYRAVASGIERIRANDGQLTWIWTPQTSQNGVLGIELISDELALIYGVALEASYAALKINLRSGQVVQAWRGTESGELGGAWVDSATVGPDGAIILGGAFDSIESVQTAYGLAKIHPDGSVIPLWGQRPDVAGSYYVAYLGAQQLLALDMAPLARWGQFSIREWSTGAPRADPLHGVALLNRPTIHDLTPSAASTCFVSGDLADVSSPTRSGVLKLDSTLGIDTSFHADLGRITQPDAFPELLSIAEGGGRLLVGRSIPTIGPAAAMMTMLDATSGQRVDNSASWDASTYALVNPLYDATTGDFLVFQPMTESGINAGFFGRISGSSLTMDPSWHTSSAQIGSNRGRAVVRDGATFYLASRTIGFGLPNLLRIHNTSPPTVDSVWAPQVSGNIMALAIDAQRGFLYVAGDFSSVNGASRPGLARFQLPSGVLDLDWNPSLPASIYDIHALTLDQDGTLYVGGDWTISTCEGSSQQMSAIRVNVSGVTDPAWRVDTDGDVRAIVIQPDNVIVGGSFSTVNGIPRASFASVGKRTDAIFSDGIGDLLCMP